MAPAAVDCAQTAPQPPSTSDFFPSVEYHGPNMSLDISSTDALAWLRRRVLAPDQDLLTDTVNWLVCDPHRGVNLDCISRAVSTPEPDPQTAWEYTQAYFEQRADEFFGVLDRDDFETRLRKHLESSTTPDTSPQWCALRNTVYALGARLVLSKKGYDPRITHFRAWNYFENALAVHSRLLFSPQNDLTGVQALALMSFYTDNLLCSSVEYMLCSNAVRLAQALGLNHEQAPPITPGQSTQDAQRKRIWWALYCYDKLISMRLGRQSCIDDDEFVALPESVALANSRCLSISVSLPEPCPGDDSNKHRILTRTIEYAQLSSRIYKSLFTVRARRQLREPDRLAVVAQLEESLIQWRNSLPLQMQPGLLVKQSAIPFGFHVDNVIYWHYSFYWAMIALHNRWPWSAPSVGSDLSLSSQSATDSRKKALDAARNTILATKHHKIDLNTAGCLVTSYPLTSVIVIFVHVLQDPLSSSAQSDVLLLGIAAGHFAKLELVTSMQTDGDVARNLANIAQRTVQAAQERKGHQDPPPEPLSFDLPDWRPFDNPAMEDYDFMDFFADGELVI